MRSAMSRVDARWTGSSRRSARRCARPAMRPSRRGRRAGRPSPRVSRMRGTLCSTTSSSVRRAHASSGRAAFLFPAGTIVPESGAPPWMTNFSIEARARGGVAGARRARVTAMSTASFARRCLDPFPRVDRVGVAAQARARRRGRDARLRGALRRGPRRVGHRRDPARPRLRALPGPRDRPPAQGPGAVRADGRCREHWIRAVASHADFLGVSRDTPMEKTLYAVDELSGFIAACAYVRPQGIHGLTPKSVKKKLKQPSFAAARQPRRRAPRRRGARRRLRRARRVRDRGARGTRRRARPHGAEAAA